jgi:hypothetical protein
MDKPKDYIIEIGGREVRVRKWPIRRAFNLTQKLMQSAAPLLARVDLEKLENPAALVGDLAAQLSDANAGLAVEMIDAALDLPTSPERLNLAEEAGLEDLVTVLDRNLVFPLSRLVTWWKSKKTSTTPAQSSPDSESLSSAP